MKTETNYDEYNRNHKLVTTVPDIDLLATMNHQHFLIDVRNEVASQVAAIVMKQLGPAIDEAIRNCEFAKESR